MKKLLISFVFFLFVSSINGQAITGSWNGILEAAPGVQLSLVFHISETDGVLSATLDSPDQNAYGIPVTTVEYSGEELVIIIKDLSLEYKGKFSGDDLLKGTFTQFGQAFDLDLKRKKE